jgi:hypothetical protein
MKTFAKTMLLTIGATALALGLAFAPASRAAEDPAAGYYGNTLHCYGSFWDCRIWFNKDHTYFSLARVFPPNAPRTAESRPIFNMEEGTWAVKGENLCRQPKGEPDPAKNTCNFPGLNMHELNHKPGDSWTGVARDGSVEHFELTAGHN